MGLELCLINSANDLERVFKTLRGHGKVSEKNIEEALKHVRRAFLEADVNFKVAKNFLDEVREVSLGTRCSSRSRPAS